MNEKLILKKDFLFGAHNEKAFQKLRDNQFARLTQGLIHEPFANALDQQPPERPVRVNLRAGRSNAMLTFEDDGEGLTRTNLEALHYIGKSSKRSERDAKIGRFGMGLVGAFNHKLNVRRIFITTNVCGKPASVTLRCKADAIPTWRLHWLDRPVSGFRISFLFPKSLHGIVKKELNDFFRDCIVKSNYNGQEIDRRPEDLIIGHGDLTGSFSNESLRVVVATPAESQHSYNKRDDLRIYLRRMLVEKTSSAYHSIYSSGDKMPQNCFSRPYLDHESIIVDSAIGEPTVGRDKLLRNDDFEKIKNAIYRARLDALLQLLPLANDADAPKAVQQNAIAHGLANIATLYSQVSKRLKGEDLGDDYEYLKPLVDTLIETPVFEVYDRSCLISIREMLAEKPPGGFFFFARESEVYHEFMRELATPFVLQERHIAMEHMWGYHRRYPVDDILKTIINQQEGLEMVSLDQLVWDEDKQRELIRKGILSRRAVRIKKVHSMTNEQEEFLARIRKMLNNPWFRNALGRFDPPARIRLHPIVEESPDLPWGGQVIAAVMGHNPRHRELDIGLNFESNAVKTLVDTKDADPAILPILCHELAHRKRNLDDGDEGIIGHTRGFYYDRVRLEDSVLQNCVRHLSGDEPDVDDELHPEVVVL